MKIRLTRSHWSSFIIHSILAVSISLPVYALTSIGTSISTDGNITISTNGSGKLGVGTTTPGTPLSITGAGVVTGNLTFPTFIATSTVATSTLSTGGLAIGANQFVVQQGSGWVGIGTNTPITQLHVAGQTPSATLSSIGTNATPLGIYIQRGYAYVTSWNSSGFQIFNISNPNAPTLVGTIASGALGGNPLGVLVNGRYAYVTCDGGCGFTLDVIDVSNPSAPRRVGTTNGGGSRTRHLAMYGNYIYATAMNSSVFNVYDVTDPTLPRLVATVSTGASSQPNGIAMQDNFIYVLDSFGNTLKVFDASNPANPVSIATLSVANGADDQIVIQDHFLYLADTESSLLRIIDISNPTVPVQVGSVARASGGGAGPIAVQGRYAFVGVGGASSIQVFDVASSTMPSLVGSFTSSTVYDLQVRGRYLYAINTTSDTLKIFDIGGAYIQQLEAGGIETGTLETRGLFRTGGNAYIGGGLSVIGSLNSYAPSGMNASSTSAVLTISQNLTGDLLTLYSGSSAVGAFRYNGLLGLGTTTPYAQLSVSSGAVGTTTLALRPIAAQTANILDIYNTSGTLTSVINASGFFGVASTSPWGLLSVNPNLVSGPEFVIGSSTKTDFIVTNAGRVGLGTTSPSAELAISSTATSTLYLGTGQSTTKGSCIQMHSPDGAAYALYVANGGTLTTLAGACK